jgi:uncharacterized protein YhaN
MGVRIHSLHAKFTTPDLDIPEMNFGDINLIYGSNESGKTAIVDFLLRCLFKRYKDFPQRSQDASGKVLVSGLCIEDAEITTFKYKGGDRLENYWDLSNPNYPIDMARLLVVRGADASLSQSGVYGVSKQILRSILGTAGSIDQISSHISATVQKAHLEAGVLIGELRGEIKTREEKLGDLKRVSGLLERLNSEYSTGTIVSLQAQLAGDEELLNKMEQARHYQAYRLNQDLETVNARLVQLTSNTLDNLRRNIHSYYERREDMSKKQIDLESLAPYSEQLPWLEQAVESYGRLLQPRLLSLPRPLWLIVSGAFLFIAVLAAFLNAPNYTAIAAFLCATFLFIYLRSMQSASSAMLWEVERKVIHQEFKRVFDRQLAGIADLKSVYEEYRSKDDRARIYKEDISSLREKLGELQTDIERDFQSLNEEAETSDWQISLDRLVQESKHLQEGQKELEIELARLDVLPEEYADHPAPLAFDYQEWQRLKNNVIAARAALTSEKEDLNSLKQVICSETDKDITIQWDDLIEALQQRRLDIISDYQGITSRIVAGILVTQALASLRVQEDELIRQGLQNPTLKQYLRHFTGVYDSFDLEGEEVILRGADEPRCFSVLSTGTYEQAMLALRMGFARMIAGDQPLFLILDDAFQYSDWQRRPWLVETLGDVAASGWQVFYFSMDDHIRGLFEENIKPAFGDRYRLYVLK